MNFICAVLPQFGHLTIYLLTFLDNLNICHFIYGSKFTVAQATYKVLFVLAKIRTTTRPHEGDTLGLVAVGTDEAIIFIEPSH
jgi:hypothetical protein